MADRSVVTSNLMCARDSNIKDPAEWKPTNGSPNEEHYSMSSGQRILRGEPRRVATPKYVKPEVEDLN